MQSKLSRLPSAMGSRRRSRGFTLVELGIVVAIGAIIIGVGIAVVPNIVASSRANSELSELPAVISGIQKAYANKSTYAGVSNVGVLIPLGVFPDNRVNGTNVTNRWGGAVTAAVATLQQANDAIRLSSAGIPKRECLEIVPALENGVRKIDVNSTAVKADGALVDLTALGTACANAQNTIHYTFSK